MFIFGRTMFIFGRKMSDVQPLFQALVSNMHTLCKLWPCVARCIYTDDCVK